jgi:hypothetical protein
MLGAKIQRMFIPLLSMWAFLGAAVPLSAAVPSTFTYQGSLKQNGAPVNGMYGMEFKLTNEAGNEVYWTSGNKLVDVKEGLYRIELAASGVDWSNKDPFIETRVFGQRHRTGGRSKGCPFG